MKHLTIGTSLASLAFSLVMLHKVSHLSACPKCSEPESSAWVMINERPISPPAETAWKEKLEGLDEPITAVSLEDGSKFLMKGYWSIEAKRPAYMQEWWNSSRSGYREIKRAIRFDGQPSSKWIVE
jgi:hypothetical protein